MKQYFSQWISLLIDADLWMWYIFLAVTTAGCFIFSGHESGSLSLAFVAFLLLIHSLTAIVHKN